jgi:signal transduction histidine kinase
MGPRSGEDAGRIWQEIEQQPASLNEMAQLFFEKKMAAEREKFRDLLQRLSVPLSSKEHLFVRTLNEAGSRYLGNVYQEPGLPLDTAEALGVQEMVLVPLTSKNRRIGLLLADNAITRRPITAGDTRSLETYALPLSFAIERAALHEQIQEELGKVREANRRLQEQQDLMVRMEKMALVGQITSSIAHSIRNPLTIIGGFARSLSRNMPPDDSRRTYIESIVREARKLEDVLQEVLNYSESMHPTLDAWDPNQLVSRVFTNLREDMELNQVSARLELDQSLAPVYLDYKQISYCLRNILTNALEAMHEGGELCVSTHSRDTMLEIRVADTGPGINTENLKAAVTPFFSTKAEGSGLGLSLVSRIVEGHGGKLQIDNGPDGTTFSLILPAAPESRSASS